MISRDEEEEAERQRLAMTHIINLMGQRDHGII